MGVYFFLLVVQVTAHVCKFPCILPIADPGKHMQDVQLD